MIPWQLLHKLGDWADRTVTQLWPVHNTYCARCGGAFAGPHECLRPPTVVEPPPLAPTVGLTPRQRELLAQHARRWCDLPTVQPGPLPVPDDHPDHQNGKATT